MTARNKNSIIRRVFIESALVIAALVLALVAGVWLILNLQISRYAEYWQKRALVVPPANALVFVALGDSAAQSVGASQPQNGYVGLLADKLQTKTGRSVHVINLSVSGAKVANVLADQLPKLEALAKTPDIITIEIGANDITTFNEADFKRDLSAVLDRLPDTVFVADIANFGNGRHLRSQKKAARASEIIAELVKNRGAHLIALQKATKEAGWRVNGIDLFHPGNYGYRVWADAFWRQVEPTLIQ